MILKWLSLWISAVKQIVLDRILFWNKLTLASTVASIKHWLNGQDYWRLFIVSRLKYMYGEFNQIKLYFLHVSLSLLFSEADWQ